MLVISYVLWTLRGGYLIASVLSSLPAWTMIDPLPILDSESLADPNADLDARNDDEESLASIIEQANLGVDQKLQLA